jgi:phenylalanyl-tRNA synthetase beta chain
VRVPLSWLREFCPTKLSADEVADVLTAHGVEVDRVLRPWEGLSGVVVAKVLEVRDHPKADLLCVATIDSGGEEREVVVGVRNFAAGDLVPYAPPGSTLPGVEGPLERREIRGVPSDGMLCSPNELRISPDHSGILLLPRDADTGRDLKGYLGMDDAVVDIEVFPNRPDLLSIVGVAREVAAGTAGDFRLPDVDVEEGEEKAADAATVEVRDTERCPRYLARVVRGVTVAAAPLPVQVRLVSGGMRPLSNVVDATNYVLLEMGQPLHPFDLSGLAGAGIVVRRAENGERLVTLDGVARLLTAEDLLIADHMRGVAVAGIMGSEVAEVGGGTTEVLIESAFFEPRGILRTARRLGLRTEASVRFERGADPEAVQPAAARAARLMVAWAGGTVLSGEIDVGESPSRQAVSVRPARTTALLGVRVSGGEVREALGRLRLPAKEEDDRVTVEVPGYRVDLEREEDLIEEVARVRGYDRIPSSLPGVRQAGGLTQEQRRHRRLREALVQAGLFETQSTSFVSASDLEVYEDRRRDGIRVANPVSEETAYLRTGLLPGLLAAARGNAEHRNPSVRLFEVGHVFLPGEKDPVEEERVGVLLSGSPAVGWPSERSEHDFLDAKGVLEDLMDVLGVEGWSLGGAQGPPYHPGRSAEVLIGDQRAGEIGELHPGIARRFGLIGRVAVFETLAAPLVDESQGEVVYRDVSRFPPVHRDLAFLIDRDVRAGDVHRALVEAAGDLVDRAVLFDVFQGQPVPEGKVNLAFSVDFRAGDRTLTDEEAEGLVRAIAERLAGRFGAELRTV